MTVLEDLKYFAHPQKTIRALRRELAQERQSNLAYQIRLGALEAKIKRDAVRESSSNWTTLPWGTSTVQRDGT